jgi:hypothetical protein
MDSVTSSDKHEFVQDIFDSIKNQLIEVIKSSNLKISLTLVEHIS